MASSSSGPQRDQYHHYIPRFILRRYLTTTDQTKSRKERQKDFRKAKKKGVELEKIFVYTIESQTLELHPLSKSFGVTNLYRVESETSNANFLEEKFSRLENDAAGIINDLHASLKDGQFLLTRKRLEILRKFLFLQQIRNASLAATYYNEDHPDNSALVAWIKKFKEAKGLQTNYDVWLHAMDYYLDTPHHVIVAEGEAIKKKSGVKNLAQMMLSGFDADMGNWLDVDYETIANTYFLGVWEAAEKSEFVLSSNSFGLWEGFPDVHRLFVVGPRLIVILRSNYSNIPELMKIFNMRSSLFDIPMEIAQSSHANKNLFDGIPLDDEKGAGEKLAEYRTTPQAQKDVYTFKITKLTVEQTYLVNQVILLNARKETFGLVTFSSKDKMLNTIHRYFNTNDPFVKKDRIKYKALKDALPNETNTTESDENPTRSLEIVFRSILNGAIEFASPYDRAFRVYDIATDAADSEDHLLQRIRQETEKAIDAYNQSQSSSNSSPTPTPQSTGPPSFLLVEKLPRDMSNWIFFVFRVVLAELGFSFGDNEEEILVEEAVIVGLMTWLIQYRRQHLHSLLDLKVIPEFYERLFAL